MDDGRYIGNELELFARAHNWKRYWSRQLAPYLGAAVLDVGAGLGETARALAGQQDRWLCLEPDGMLAEQITNRVVSGELPPVCEVRVGTIDSVPERDFSSALYIDVLEHIEDHQAEIAKAADHVVAAGRVIVLAPAHQWLYSPFDQAIGHYRRYTLASLKALTPSSLEVERAFYLDCVGLFASLANKMIMKASMPTARQIDVWNRAMVPLSRIIDPLFANRIGKTAVIVWRKRPE